MAGKKKPQPKVFRPSPRMRLFLAAVRITPSITVAAKVAGINRTAHYRTLERNPLYKAAFNEAYRQGVDSLEDEITRRAQFGVKRLKLYHGSPVMVPRDLTKKASKRNPLVPYFEAEESDTLAALLMKAKKPKEYRDRVEHELGDKTLKKFDGTMEDLLALYRHLTTAPEGEDEK